MKRIRLRSDPGQELGEEWIGLEAAHIGQSTRDLGFGETRVNGAVAELVEVNRSEPGAALQLRHEMVTARFGARRDRTIAERAYLRRCRRRRPSALAITSHDEVAS